MKSIAIGLLWLLCSAAWAQELSDDDVEPIPDEEPEPQPILQLFTYKSEAFGLSLHKLTWFEAQQYCASQAYTLASIPTESSQDTLTSFIYTYAANELLLLANEPIWTSGTNQGAVNQYVWHSTGAQFSYRNFPGTIGSGFRCVALNAITGAWTAENCRDQRYFICEPASCAPAEDDEDDDK